MYIVLMGRIDKCWEYHDVTMLGIFDNKKSANKAIRNECQILMEDKSRKLDESGHTPNFKKDKIQDFQDWLLRNYTVYVEILKIENRHRNKLSHV